MKTDQLYICCQANNPLCHGCKHSYPHTIVTNGGYGWQKEERCTVWTECFDTDGNCKPYKVRCVKVKDDNA